MKVLVVGAGPSGLAALKEMREAGLDAVAVDERASFGGVFAPESGVTFQGLHLTISNIYMSYSDFPAYDVDKGVKFWSKLEYFEYLAQYVAHFGLAPHIRLQTRVEQAHFDHTRGRWQVRMRSSEGEVSEADFDRLIVASGANHTPYVPQTLQGFGGELLHSAAYHTPDQVRGKRVLVVGMGEGAADVASSATQTAASVTVWARHAPDCAPRFVKTFLTDPGYDEQEHLERHHRPNEVLEGIIISRAVRNLPLGLWSVALQGLTTDMAKKHGADSTQGVLRAMVSRAWEKDFFSSDTSVVPTKSSVALTAAARGDLDLVITPDITVDGRHLSFHRAEVFGGGGTDGAANATEHDAFEQEFDVVIACTGFGLDFDWISTSQPGVALTRDPRTWFKHCFPPGMGEHLAMVGFARPHSGGIPQCAEMVSRYIAQLYLKNRTLPADYPTQAIADGEAETACFHQAPGYRMLVDYMAYMMSVAKLVGCEPRANPSLLSPSDAVKHWTFPLWPCFFRTQGVGAKPEAVEAVLGRFGTYDAVAPMPLLALQLVCGFVMPVVNLGSLAADALIPGLTRAALPRLYRWRLSKMYFMYDNSLTPSDFKGVYTQWLASSMVLGHAVKEGLRGLLPGRRKQQAPQPEQMAS